VTALHMKLLKLKREKLLVELREHVVGLVDAFMYNDNNLRSAIGRYDGKAYETLWEWATNFNKFNKENFDDVFEKSLKPMRYLEQKPRPKI